MLVERKRVLILGGTAEAREIATGLVAMGHDVTTSLAGVTAAPLIPAGRLRVGGFGGVEGLRQFLRAGRFDVLVDATHAFAAQISHNAHEAVQELPIELIRFERVAWVMGAHLAWRPVNSLEEAAQALPQAARAFITTGRKELSPFMARHDVSGVIRTVEPPELVSTQWHVILDRPPHDVHNEIVLMQTHGITHLVTKNSGGMATFAKLEAASTLGVHIIMVERPQKPACETFTQVADLLSRLGRR